MKQLTAFYKDMLRSRQKPGHTYFDELEADIDRRRGLIMEQAKNLETLTDRESTIYEH